jgi:hypothetical protein
MNTFFAFRPLAKRWFRAPFYEIVKVPIAIEFIAF